MGKSLESLSLKFLFSTSLLKSDILSSLSTIFFNSLSDTSFILTSVKYRVDEIPQLFNVLIGDMSFVGTRPEVKKYVNQYTPEMYATLLLPAGVTSLASIEFKDEDEILERYTSKGRETNEVYVKEVLPLKMEYNLKAITSFNFIKELGTMISTVVKV